MDSIGFDNLVDHLVFGTYGVTEFMEAVEAQAGALETGSASPRGEGTPGD